MTEKEYRETYAKGYLQCVDDLIKDIGEHKVKVSKEVFDLLVSNSLGLSRIKDFEFTDWIEEASDTEIHTEDK